MGRHLARYPPSTQTCLNLGVHPLPSLPSVRLTNLVSLIKVVFVLMETYITVLAPGLGFT
jgi:multisubunit Na+/H+ antiporter MnhB subunit